MTNLVLLIARTFVSVFTFVLTASNISSADEGDVANSATSTPFWHAVGEDLETGEMKITSRALFTSQLTFFRTSLNKYRIGVIRASEYGWKRSDVKSLSRTSKAVLGINANFFDEQWNPLGIIVSRGIVLQKIHKGGTTLTGIFQVTRHGISIVNRQSFQGETILEALQAGPRLLSAGTPVDGIRESLTPSKRAGLCIDKSGRLIFFAVSSRFIGLDIEELQNVLLQKNIDCVDALNLDGGGSAQLYVSDKLPSAVPDWKEFYISGDDEVPVILGLFVKQ